MTRPSEGGGPRFPSSYSVLLSIKSYLRSRLYEKHCFDPECRLMPPIYDMSVIQLDTTESIAHYSQCSVSRISHPQCTNREDIVTTRPVSCHLVGHAAFPMPIGYIHAHTNGVRQGTEAPPSLPADFVCPVFVKSRSLRTLLTLEPISKSWQF